MGNSRTRRKARRAIKRNSIAHQFLKAIEANDKLKKSVKTITDFYAGRGYVGLIDLLKSENTNG